MRIIKKAITKNNNELLLIEKLPRDSSSYQKTVLVIGAMHGDEPQGKFLIEDYLENSFFDGINRLLFIPCLNPDGFNFKTRTNANGVDLNRNFVTTNWGESLDRDEFYGGDSPASEVETVFVQEVIDEYAPDVILAFHAPFKVVNYDGPAQEIAQKISEIINYPIQEDIGYPTPGSFGTYAGIERNIPTITLELDEEVDIETLKKPVKKIFDFLSTYSAV